MCTTFGFQQPVVYTTGSSPQAIVSADFNHDRHLDLAISNYDENTISVLLGIGDGSFQLPAIKTASGGTHP